MRTFGLVLGILMLLSLTGPLILAMLLATGKISLLAGLVGAALLGVIIFLATQNFLMTWKSSHWTSARETPNLVGKTLSSAMAYATLLALVGYLIQVLCGG